MRRAGSEIWAGTLDELRVLHAGGRLRGDDEVWDGSAWVSPNEALAPRRAADPFAAWDDADGVDAEALLAQVVGPGERGDARRAWSGRPERSLPPAVEAEVPPLEDERTDPGVRVAVAPARPAAPRSAPPEPQVAAAGPEPVPPPLRAAPEEPVAPMLSPRPRRPPPPAETGPLPGAEVIRFPTPRPEARDVWTPERPAPPPAAPLVRPGVLLGYLAMGLLVLGIGAWWTRLGADGNYGVRPRATRSTVAVAPPTAPAAATSTGSGPRLGAPASDPLLLLEEELRAGASGTLRPVRRPGDLGDAVLIDLQNLRVGVETVQAEVTEWSGRMLDEPRRARVSVQLYSADELDRSLGAVAMVVGRYKSAYRLQMEPIEVRVRTSQGDGRKTLDADRAEAFYAQRLSLRELLGAG